MKKHCLSWLLQICNSAQINSYKIKSVDTLSKMLPPLRLLPSKLSRKFPADLRVPSCQGSTGTGRPRPSRRGTPRWDWPCPWNQARLSVQLSAAWSSEYYQLTDVQIDCYFLENECVTCIDACIRYTWNGAYLIEQASLLKRHFWSHECA